MSSKIIGSTIAGLILGNLCPELIIAVHLGYAKVAEFYISILLSHKL